MSVKKNKTKNKYIPIVLVVLLVVILVSTGFVVYIASQNYVVYANIDNSAELQSDNDAKIADVILVNDVVIGGVLNNNWFLASDLYDNQLISKNKLEVKMYNVDGILGTYYTSIFKNKNNLYYTKTTKEDVEGNYVAVSNTNTNSNIAVLSKVEANNLDTKKVKQAIGKYKWFNNTVNITEVYEVGLKENETGRLVFVTSNGSSVFGVYSAIVYYNANTINLIKYAYVQNTGLSSAWPVYSMIDVVNIDGDGTPELIIQETTAMTVKYSIIEYMNDKKDFYQVLQTEVKL